MTEFAHDLEATPTLRLVVDAANVVGTRPDGWWRDRAGAAARLRDKLAALARLGLAPDDLPDGVTATAVERVHCEIVMVVEGKASRIAGQASADPNLQVVAAPGDGDDQIVAQAARLTPPVVVVTADRGLKARVAAAGALIAGPVWLLELLDAITASPQA